MKTNWTYRTIACFCLAFTGVAFAQDPTIGGQLLMSVDPASNSGDETSSVSTPNGMEIIGGFNDFRNDGSIKSAFGTSSDGGNTWAHVIIRPPASYQSSVEGDPFTAYDRRTNTMWAGAMSFAGNGGIYIAKKTAGQNSFQASTMARIDGGVDKGWAAAGPLPGNQNSTRLYITFNEGVIYSDDLGATFSAVKSLGLGLGILPRVGPSGQLYITYWDEGTGVMFKRSLDGGNTFTTVHAATRMDTWGTETNNGRVPGSYRIPPIQTMAVNPVNGDIVIMYFDTTNTVNGNRNLDLYMVKSTDQGTSWTTPTRLPFRPLSTIGDMFFPWLEYTPDGRLHLLAFDSSYTNQNDGGAHGYLDQDYAYSDDDGADWTKFRLTPSSFDSYNDGRGLSTSFMGDYSGVGISDRRVFPVYLDTLPGKADVYTNIVYNPIVRPTTLSFYSGRQLGGTLQSLFLHDGDSVTASPGPVSIATEPPLQMQVSGSSPSTNPAYLKVYLWTSVNSPNIEQRVLMLNVGTQSWDQVDARPASQSLTNVVVNVPNPQNYIAADGTVQARIAFIATKPIVFIGWKMTADEAVFLVG